MSISQQVSDIVSSDLSLQKDIHRGLINHRALARYLIDKYDFDASLDAVISALRRIELEPLKEFDKKITGFFKDASISTRNNLVCFTLKKEALFLLPKIISKNIRIVTGTDEINLIVEKTKSETLHDIFSQYIIKTEKDLGEVSIRLAEEAAKTRGVMSRIANEISLNKINIEQLLISVPEFLIYVKDKDVIKTHEVLLGLSGS
ncbi:MAG: hypothetical protein HY512_03170 [Candidatus Aenigmarchaeota archaeon]|nr:hypothetical protein [Candidatus Aenigmarchaeota archaeon]